jgi:hypothetical protein
MKSEKLTVPEFFWARFKGKDKVLCCLIGADEVDKCERLTVRSEMELESGGVDV